MTWPRNYHPLDADGAPDTSVTVQLHPHEPGQTDALAQWCEVNGTPTERLFLNGGPALLLIAHLPYPDVPGRAR